MYTVPIVVTEERVDSVLNTLGRAIDLADQKLSENKE